MAFPNGMQVCEFLTGTRGATYAQVVSGAPRAAGGCDGGAPGAAVRGGAHGAAGDRGGAPGAAGGCDGGAHGAAAVSRVRSNGNWTSVALPIYSYLSFVHGVSTWYVHPESEEFVYTREVKICGFSYNFSASSSDLDDMHYVMTQLWYAFSDNDDKSAIQNYFFTKNSAGELSAILVKKDNFATHARTPQFQNYWNKRGCTEAPDWIEQINMPNSIKRYLEQRNEESRGTGVDKWKVPEKVVKISLTDDVYNHVMEIAATRKTYVEKMDQIKCRLDELKAKAIDNGVWSFSPDEIAIPIFGTTDCVGEIPSPDIREMVFSNSTLLFKIKSPNKKEYKNNTRVVLCGGVIYVISVDELDYDIVQKFAAEYKKSAITYFKNEKFKEDGILASAIERIQRNNQQKKYEKKRKVVDFHKSAHAEGARQQAKQAKYDKSKSKKVEKTVLSNEFGNREDWWSAFQKAIALGDEPERVRLRDIGRARKWL